MGGETTSQMFWVLETVAWGHRCPSSVCRHQRFFVLAHNIWLYDLSRGVGLCSCTWLMTYRGRSTDNTFSAGCLLVTLKITSVTLFSKSFSFSFYWYLVFLPYYLKCKHILNSSLSPVQRSFVTHRAIWTDSLLSELALLRVATMTSFTTKIHTQLSDSDVKVFCLKLGSEISKAD